MQIKWNPHSNRTLKRQYVNTEVKHHNNQKAGFLHLNNAGWKPSRHFLPVYKKDAINAVCTGNVQQSAKQWLGVVAVVLNSRHARLNRNRGSAVSFGVSPHIVEQWIKTNLMRIKQQSFICLGCYGYICWVFPVFLVICVGGLLFWWQMLKNLELK